MATVRERRNPKMMNWYMNPELHDQDYEDLMALLAEASAPDPDVDPDPED